MIIDILDAHVLSNSACVATVEAMVSYLDTDALVNSKLFPESQSKKKKNPWVSDVIV